MTLASGTRGVDFAFMPKRLGIPVGYRSIAKNGAKFVSRYSAGVNGAVNGKTIRDGEIAHAVSHGVDFLGNFELLESTPTEGAAAGKRHGLADKAFYAQRGYAPNAGITISWEPGSDKSQFTAVGNFIEAYRNATGRPVGLYAGLPALLFFRKQGLIDMTWLPMSAAASGLTGAPSDQKSYAAFLQGVAKDNGINLCQNRNRWYNGAADENVVTTPWRKPWTHLEALAAASAPKPIPAPDPAPSPEKLTPSFHPSHRLVSADQTWDVVVRNDGKVSVRHHGKHVRFL